MDQFDGIGPDVVVECVSTKESIDTALRAVRPGGKIGFVGVPDGGPELEVQLMFDKNVGVDGSVAFVGDYIPELLPDVLTGTVQPGGCSTSSSRSRSRRLRGHGQAPRHQGPAAALVARRASPQN